MQLRAEPVTAEAFAPFGTLVLPPEAPGERAFYTQWLGATAQDATPRLHVNFVPQSMLPITATVLERHPHAAQIFLPLEASRYLIVVTPSLPDGSPDLARARCFVAPGNVGVVYRAMTWHMGATALDAKAHFAVCMWRNDRDDDEFLTLTEPLELLAESKQ
ncbi:ureidoglycolate lyase [Granulicella cerasi]|uniref:Ureidoglycolate lyase n=1 Tax=Granulicella cerasi TaxID=741063 RepID=A0ABW1ZAG4_9BACT|nr:ureidoglycolate lyase [Granulicella cerasi]